MPPIIALLLSALGQIGIDPRDLLNKGVREALIVIRQRLESHWLKSVDDIAEEMAAQGWKLDSTSPERPAPPEDYVGRVEYKLWHRAVPGGPARDWLRDRDNRQVTSAVAASLDPANHAHNVRAIIPVVLSDTFDPLIGLVGGSNPTTAPAPGPPAPVP